MFGDLAGQSTIDRSVLQLFALVSEGLAQATHALLAGEHDTALEVIERDERVDALVAEVEAMVWAEIEGYRPDETCDTWSASCRSCPSSSGARTWPSTSRAGRRTASDHRCRRSVGGSCNA